MAWSRSTHIQRSRAWAVTGVYRERWIDLVHARRPPDGIILDMSSSDSSTHGEQESFQPGSVGVRTGRAR